MRLARYLLPIIAAVLAASVTAQAQSDRRPELTVAVAENPPGLEPADALSNVGTRVTYSLFDTLIRRDFLSAPGGSGSKLVPHLATAWERIGPTTLEVKLRQGVKFHNGDELTSADVAFTFSPERLTGPQAALPEGRAYFGVLDRVEEVDRYTVRFHTRGTDVLLEQRLASWASWIVNKREWHAKGKDGFGRQPVGTGPFKLRRMVPGDLIRLEAFDDYFMGRPTARAVNFKVVPEVSARIAGLVSGEFDIVVNLPPDQVQIIDRYKDLETRSVVLANSHVLVYNTSHPVLQDKRVRQALNLAIDRQLLVNSLWGGKAVTPNGHQYPEYGEMYDAERPPPAYDPAKARALLQAAGYKGEKIVYATQPNYYLNALAAAQAMVEMWKAVGINAELKVLESFSQLKPDENMIRNWSNSTRYPDPLGAIWIAWGAEGSAQKTWKTWTDAPAEFNELGVKLANTADVKARFAMARRLLDIWEEEAPGTVLYQPVESYAARKAVTWQPYTFYYMDLRPYNLQFAGR